MRDVDVDIGLFRPDIDLVYVFFLSDGNRWQDPDDYSDRAFDSGIYYHCHRNRPRGLSYQDNHSREQKPQAIVSHPPERRLF